jgi:hypothetical protein
VPPPAAVNQLLVPTLDDHRDHPGPHCTGTRDTCMSAAKHVNSHLAGCVSASGEVGFGLRLRCNSTPLERVIVSTGSAAKLIIIGPADVSGAVRGCKQS